MTILTLIKILLVKFTIVKYNISLITNKNKNGQEDIH